MKTLAIRLNDDLHAQLVLVAKVDGLALVEVIRQAVERFVSDRRSDPELAGRVTSLLEEIDREATARRSAVEALLGQAEVPAAPAQPATSAPARKTGRAGRSGPGQTD